MAYGKNKRISKSKKGGKKRVGDPMAKKEWYDLKAPSMFHVRSCGKTLVTKSAGTKLATDGLKGRVFELNLADLQTDDDQAFRKIKLCCEDVQEKNCLTDFHGMDITRDKLCSMVRKWHSLIEASVDVKTTDGYLLRMFCIAFTNKHKTQVRTTCYARTSQIRRIRAIMMDTMTKEANKVQLRELVKKFIPESIGTRIEGACKHIFPLQSVYIRKVKILKKPKLDIAKLMELHDNYKEDLGKTAAVREDGATNLLTSEIKAAAEQVPTGLQ